MKVPDKESEANGMSQLIEEPRLFENLCSTVYLGVGVEWVKRNKGSVGIDGVGIQALEANLDEEPIQLQQELTGWTYQPSQAHWFDVSHRLRLA
jgi:RNA-directed DNA polymerase